MRIMPLGAAMAPDRIVDIKVNTKNFFAGWAGLGRARWQQTSERELSIKLDQSGHLTSFQLLLRLNEDDTCHVRLQSRGAFRGHPLTFSVPGIDLPCSNFWMGNLDVAEWGDGHNNNGQGLRIESGAIALQLWPKREDRIRMDVQRAPGMAALEFELDTRE